MELYVDNSAPYITEFWQKFIGRLTQLLYSKRLDDMVSRLYSNNKLRAVQSSYNLVIND